jgi:hypothetical protein
VLTPSRTAVSTKATPVGGVPSASTWIVVLPLAVEAFTKSILPNYSAGLGSAQNSALPPRQRE